MAPQNICELPRKGIPFTGQQDCANIFPFYSSSNRAANSKNSTNVNVILVGPTLKTVRTRVTSDSLKRRERAMFLLLTHKGKKYGQNKSKQK